MVANSDVLSTRMGCSIINEFNCGVVITVDGDEIFEYLGGVEFKKITNPDGLLSWMYHLQSGGPWWAQQLKSLR